MSDERVERIKQRAHELWEQEGRPEGRHSEHWEQATREIEAEEAGGQQGGAAGGGPSDLTGAGDPQSGLPSELQPGGAETGGGEVEYGGRQDSTGRGDLTGAGDPKSGLSSDLQPGGAKPGASPAAGEGSIGTGGGSTAGAASGTAKRRTKKQ
jgi:Protein of unknown function (DUF2934)